MVLIKIKDLRHHQSNIGEVYLSRKDSLSSDDALREARIRIAKRSMVLHDTMLGGRVAASLERFQHTHSQREAEEVLKDEADRAFSTAESSYTLLRVIVWATPIMGFIGTVLGVSQSVGGLSNVLGGDVEVDADGLGVSDVREAVWLGGKPRDHARVPTLLQILLDACADEVELASGGF